ncbi:hypothetical protein ISN45_Aa04g027920, partial [Arabidopsis thaliana x Arabidopsis arenosa]
AKQKRLVLAGDVSSPFGVDLPPAITIVFALSSLVSLSLSVYISWNVLGGHVNPAV